jgi:hypothetical protein
VRISRLACGRHPTVSLQRSGKRNCFGKTAPDSVLGGRERKTIHSLNDPQQAIRDGALVCKIISINYNLADDEEERKRV